MTYYFSFSKTSMLVDLHSLLSAFFVAGVFLIMTSFIDAFTLRVEKAYFSNKRKTITNKLSFLFRGRSHCDCHEQKKLQIIHLIPLFSYFFLRGKCSYCHQPLSKRYIINEVIAFIYGFSVFFFASSTWLWITLSLYWCLLYILIYLDSNYFILPWEYILLFGLVAFLELTITHYLGSTRYFIIAGFVIPHITLQLSVAFMWIFFFGVLYIIFPGKLGFSDVLFIFVLSLALPYKLSLLLPSFSVCLVFIELTLRGILQYILPKFALWKTLLIMLKQQHKPLLKTKIPFGVYLAIAFLCMKWISMTSYSIKYLRFIS